MKKIVLITISLLASSAAFTAETPAYRSSLSHAEARCGARLSYASNSYSSDDGRFEDFYTSNRSIRSITIRSTKKKTVVTRLKAYDNNTRRWLNFTPRIKRKARCEVRGGLCNNQEVTICIGKRRDISQVSVFTVGSNRGKYNVRFGYKRR